MSLGFADKRSGASTASGSTAVGTAANYTSPAAMRTRLAAINGTYYTTARLNSMTENDLTYALRLADDAAGIK